MARLRSCTIERTWVGRSITDIDWKGNDLKQLIEEEIADVAACIGYVVAEMGLDEAFIQERLDMKMAKFYHWKQVGEDNGESHE